MLLRNPQDRMDYHRLQPSEKVRTETAGAWIRYEWGIASVPVLVDLVADSNRTLVSASAGSRQLTNLCDELINSPI